jgi:2-amino-4-hydroxy-6-hydroxymethyldihydropteridine diphosphokinase
MQQVSLSLGSNINPEYHISASIKHLRKILSDIKVSSIYLTSPWGVTQQNNYLNCVVIGNYEHSPHQLLHQCQTIENTFNRERTFANAPRTLDIDILLFNSFSSDSKNLTIPHPGLLERDFMLIPLLEVAPEALNPTNLQPLKEHINRLKYHHIISKIHNNHSKDISAV